MSKPMPRDTEKRCKSLRARSKKGEWLSPSEFKFLESCWEQWPERYKEIGNQTFVETAPFGSRLPNQPDSSQVQP